MTIDEIRLNLYGHFLKINPDMTIGGLERLAQEALNRRKIKDEE